MRTDLITPATVRRRRADDGDGTLRRDLFLASRPEFVTIPADVRELLVHLQLTAQRWQQSADHADLRHEVLMTGDGGTVDCGMLTTASDADAVHVVDIAVLPAHRDRGIGSTALRQVADDAAGRDVRLFVWADNAGARRLYERLGFSYDDERSTGAGHLAMVLPGVRN